MRRRALVASSLLLVGAVAAEPVRVLSAGALEPGLSAVLERWRSQGGGAVAVAFATVPRITERLAAGGEQPDLLLAPENLIERLGRSGDLAAEPVVVGSVGVGIAVREGAPVPAIRDEASLREHLLAADTVVFNRASTGLYMERLLDRLGLAAAIEAKTLRFPDGDGVLRRIAAGSGREIAFAAATEIALFRGRGVRSVGPLLDGLQNRTSYAAGLLSGGGAEARRFLAFLGTDASRSAMAEAGVERP